MIHIKIILDPAKEERFRQLAKSQGKEITELAQVVLEDYLDLQSWVEDKPEGWGEASLALAVETFPQETWEEDDNCNGPR